MCDLEPFSEIRSQLCFSRTLLTCQKKFTIVWCKIMRANFWRMKLENTFGWRYFGSWAVMELKLALLLKVETWRVNIWRLLANPPKYSPSKILRYKVICEYFKFILLTAVSCVQIRNRGSIVQLTGNSITPFAAAYNCMSLC